MATYCKYSISSRRVWKLGWALWSDFLSLPLVQKTPGTSCEVRKADAVIEGATSLLRDIPSVQRHPRVVKA
jgi:hypothetical protein